MAGTKIGGAKCAATNKRKYGEDFYTRIGRDGGKLGRTGGFYVNRELARTAGRKGGLVSKRRPNVPQPSEEDIALAKSWKERIFGR